MNISIVTVNFNGSEHTLKLLGSLKNQIDKEFDFIIVDNNSESQDLQNLKNQDSEGIKITFLENNKNLGFSGGNNVGIKRALGLGSEWILLLNNDTWVENNFISLLKTNLKLLSNSKQEGMAGIAIDESFSDNSEQSRIVYAGKIEWLKPTLNHLMTFDIIRKNNDIECRYYAIGGAVAIHKKVFEKIGFLDENYFLYFEDADFSIRTWRAKFPINFFSGVKVYHSTSSTTKKMGSPMLLYYHFRNAFYFNRKNGPLHIKALNWFWRQWLVKKQLFKIIFGINREQSKAILEGAYDYSKNKMGKHD